MWSGAISGCWNPWQGWNLPLPHVPEGVWQLGSGTRYGSNREFRMGAGKAV